MPTFHQRLLWWTRILWLIFMVSLQLGDYFESVCRPGSYKLHMILATCWFLQLISPSNLQPLATDKQDANFRVVSFRCWIIMKKVALTKPTGNHFLLTPTNMLTFRPSGLHHSSSEASLTNPVSGLLIQHSHYSRVFLCISWFCSFSQISSICMSLKLAGKRASVSFVCTE